MFREDWNKHHIESNRFDLLWTAVYTIYELFTSHVFFLINLFKKCVEQFEMHIQQLPAIITNVTKFFSATL